jgi:hypothetical protein
MADLFVERIEEFADMAGMNTTAMSSRQRLLAEQAAGYGAEQRRLKAAAAGRRAAAALAAGAGKEADRWRPPAVADRGVDR